MSLELRDDIPVPTGGRGFRNYAFPFAQMKVGQSFFVATPSNSRAPYISSVSASARHWTTKNGNGHKFTCATVTEEGVAGVRCWRIA